MDKLQKLLHLVKKTNGKAIISDTASDDIYVISLATDWEQDGCKHSQTDSQENNKDAESIESLSEEGLLDKINQDVQDWQAKKKDYNNI